MTEISINVASNTRQATISGLSPSTLYTIQVAAVNGAGTGPYSTPGIDIWTNGMYIWCANRLVRGECMSMTKPNSTNC